MSNTTSEAYNATDLDYLYDHFDSHIFTRMGYRVYGIFLCSVVVVFTIVYVFVLWVFISKKEFRENVAYQLIIHLGITDGINIINSILVRFVEIFPYRFKPGVLFGKIYRAYDGCSLLPPNLMTLALALHRTHAIVKFRCLEHVKDQVIGNCLAAAAYLTWFAVYLAIYFSPEDAAGAYAGIDDEILKLNSRLANSQGFAGSRQHIIFTIIFYFQYGTVIFSVILYLWCTWDIVKKRKTADGPILSSNERRLLIQTMVPCFIKLFCQAQWFYVVIFNMYAEGAQNFLLTIDTNYLPFFYLAVNRKLRKYSLQMLGLKKIEQMTTTTITTTTNKYNTKTIATAARIAVSNK